MMNVIGKLCLIIFLIWHLFAVAVYSVPREADDDFATLAKQTLIPFVTPYMYMTSQWQLWNIFSPDPLRRVTAYRIETEQDGVWRELETIGPDTYSVFRHAARMKMMGNMLSEFDDNRMPYARSFLQHLCTDHPLPSGTPIRLVYRVYVLPLLQQPQTAAWWRAWQPAIDEHTGFITTCS